MGMTVQELIDELEKVENKTLPIISEEERSIIGLHEYEDEFVKLYEHDQLWNEKQEKYLDTMVNGISV